MTEHFRLSVRETMTSKVVALPFKLPIIVTSQCGVVGRTELIWRRDAKFFMILSRFYFSFFNLKWRMTQFHLTEQELPYKSIYHL